jgi:hypothetical protein
LSARRLWPWVRKRPAHKKAAPACRQTHPLAAVPVPAPGVERRAGAAGEWHLRRRLPAASRVGRWWSARTGMARTVQVVLDEHGMQFWDSLDGERDLLALSNGVARRFKLTESGSRERVVQYTQMLMRRHLVQLRVPQAAQSVEPENHNG